MRQTSGAGARIVARMRIAEEIAFQADILALSTVLEAAGAPQPPADPAVQAIRKLREASTVAEQAGTAAGEHLRRLFSADRMRTSNSAAARKLEHEAAASAELAALGEALAAGGHAPVVAAEEVRVRIKQNEANF